jgi:hypothetical protein
VLYPHHNASDRKHGNDIPSYLFAILRLTQAHQHVEKAENYVAQGLLIPAAEEHYKAAETFKACIEQTSDEGVRYLFLSGVTSMNFLARY